MIPWKDNVDLEQAVIEALKKNGLPVSEKTHAAGKLLVIPDGDDLQIKALPRGLKRRSAHSGKVRYHQLAPNRLKANAPQESAGETANLPAIRLEDQLELRRKTMEAELSLLDRKMREVQLELEVQHELALQKGVRMFVGTAALKSMKTKKSFCHAKSKKVPDVP